jgi:hypothetical protein
LARGAAHGLAAVRGPHAEPWAVAAGEAAIGCLADFPARAVRCSDDMLASVVARVGLAPAGTAVLALEPEDALRLVRDRLGAGPWVPALALDAVRDVGAAMLRGALAALLGDGSGFGPVRLEEDALTSTLLRTHAPPEAALLSVELLVAGEHVALRGVLLVLVDPKGLAALVTGAEARGR